VDLASPFTRRLASTRSSTAEGDGIACGSFGKLVTVLEEKKAQRPPRRVRTR